MRVVALLALLAAVPAVPRAASEERLPPSARMLLLDKMGNHKHDMTGLSDAVLLLDHRKAAALAARIAGEPRLATPKPDEDALNSLVPPRFFELQDELRERAERLAAAAREGDDAAIAKAYGALAETCVRCHAAYLNEPSGP